MWSQLQFANGMLNVKEADVEILVCLLLEVTSGDPADSWLEKARANWESNRRGRGLGMTDIDFDALVTNVDEHSRMLDLLVRVDAWLASRAPAIPRTEINAMKPPYSQFYGDPNVVRLRHVYQGVAEFLQATAGTWSEG